MRAGLDVTRQATLRVQGNIYVKGRVCWQGNGQVDQAGAVAVGWSLPAGIQAISHGLPVIHCAMGSRASSVQPHWLRASHSHIAGQSDCGYDQQC